SDTSLDLYSFPTRRSSDLLFREVQQLSRLDSLTGVYNRRHLFELCQREFDRAQRYGRSLSVVMIDLDQFKAVNDTYGHAAGLERSEEHTSELQSQSNLVCR